MNQTEIDEAVKLMCDAIKAEDYKIASEQNTSADEDYILQIIEETDLFDYKRLARAAFESAAPLMARVVAAQAEKIKRLEAIVLKAQGAIAVFSGYETDSGAKIKLARQVLTELNAAMKE